MRINKLKIINLRNHIDTSIELSPKLNIFYGKNGSGKTTILESIAILSLTKSFIPATDSALIRTDAEFYNLYAECVNDLDIKYKINIIYNGTGRKVINNSYGENLIPKKIIGEIPLVVLSPDFKSITFGSPQDRRQFVDIVLSQSDRLYFEELSKHKKLLKQRNNILNNYLKNKQLDINLLETITTFFINSCAEIIFKRYQFINRFEPFFIDAYKKISKLSENPKIIYKPNLENLTNSIEISKNNIIENLNYKYKKLKDIELTRGLTLFGPQKDDFEFYVDNRIAKESASQGQHKTLLISIKLSEFNFLKNIRNETPILMLDDIYSELDSERSIEISSIIKNLNCQTLITSTNKDLLNLLLKNENFIRFFYVENGNVKINAI
jgi:DNA replication and repair protein RecF